MAGRGIACSSSFVDDGSSGQSLLECTTVNALSMKAEPRASFLVGGMRAPRPTRLGDLSRGHDLHEYDAEIYEWMRRSESSMLANGVFARQKQITPKMRAFVVEWLVDIHSQQLLHTDSLYTAVRLVDLYLAQFEVSKDRLQRLAAAALLLAAKDQETRPPSLSELCEALGTCDEMELIGLEAALLEAVGYRLAFPVAPQFLKRYLRIAAADRALEQLAHYILEMSLLQDEHSALPPSLAAVVALLVACGVRGSGWRECLMKEAPAPRAEVEELAAQLLEVVRRFGGPRSHCAIRRKYSSMCAGRVATLRLPARLRF